METHRDCSDLTQLLYPDLGGLHHLALIETLKGPAPSLVQSSHSHKDVHHLLHIGYGLGHLTKSLLNVTQSS